VITSIEFRDMFLSFFRERKHEIVRSSPVVPTDDPTLLFINAGMNQFKNIFLGIEKADFSRAASVQKCIRASGKHNDLEDVGKDGRHHTFFEMLGNWSFGDYYKKEAALWAWEFVTVNMGLPENHLWVSIYKDDQEAYDAWVHDVSISPDRIVRLGDIEKGDMENFWAMGDIGPCGPCSEIHYDYYPSSNRDFYQGSSNGEIIELWNLVFMEFNRHADGTFVPLPAKNIDTGMGLERALAILQGVTSNYETDLFTPLLKKIEAISGVSAKSPKHLVSFQVIADHVRSLAFGIADGAVPSNEGRGYVLRRILRRAVRHGKLLGLGKPFLYTLVDPLSSVMGSTYQELVQRQDVIKSIIRNEEELFLRTLDRGLEEFAKTVKKIRKEGGNVFPGEEAFILHDTYGFPLDLTQIMAEEESLILGREGYEREMAEQRRRAQEGSMFKGEVEQGQWIILREEEKTDFTGYHSLTQANMHIIKYKKEDGEVYLVFDRTPFYGEAGGQVGDTGYIEGNGVRVRINDVKKVGESFIHVGEIEKGELKDVPYTGYIDVLRRKKIMANHTATHILHYVLRKLIGVHVAQAGSLVAPDRLRFDFTHYSALTDKELGEIERLVNMVIFQNLPVDVLYDVPMDEALSTGAIALFGEKYRKNVRVVKVEDLSLELCGGTHVMRTGDIGIFKILKESSISSGVRRIEAVTNITSLDLIQRNEGLLKEMAAMLGAGYEDLPDKVKVLQERIHKLEKSMKRDRKKRFELMFDPDRDSVRAGDFTLVRLSLPGYSQDELREISDKIKANLKMAVVFLASARDNKASYVLSATEDAVKNGIHSGALLKEVLKGCDGSGGGRSHLAQGGGTDPDKISKAFERLREILEGKKT